MKNRIEDFRKEIDNIDRNILDLLHKRIEIAKQIYLLKKKDNMNIYQPEREKVVLTELLKENKKVFPEKSLYHIFTEIFSASRKIQNEIKVGYLGPEATFTHFAAIKLFGSETKYIGMGTIYDIFTEVESGYIDFGVVPIENSNEGVVGYTLDMLIEFSHSIVNEIYLEISNNLISKEKNLSRIKTLYSHQQPLAQCRTFIRNNMPGVKIIETSSTAEAAKIAAKKKKSAALASRLAADIYNLNVLAENVQDNINNYTRFLVIAKEPISLSKKSKNIKTSIVCNIKDRPGALFSLIKPFNEYKINMTKIESRPTKKRAWEYMFFIDFLGKTTDENIKKALKMVEDNSTYFKILGSYPSAVKL